MTHEREQIENEPSEFITLKNWLDTRPENLEQKHSKVVSSLVNSIENGFEHYTSDMETSMFCFETALQLAEELVQRDWTNQTEKQKFKQTVIPALRTIVEENSQQKNEMEAVTC